MRCPVLGISWKISSGQVLKIKLPEIKPFRNCLALENFFTNRFLYLEPPLKKVNILSTRIVIAKPSSA